MVPKQRDVTGAARFEPAIAHHDHQFELDPDQLIARNTDVISPEEQATLRSMRVLVAGCGSVGGSIVEPLVRLGLGAIVLADPEPYDVHNINRQSCLITDIGRSKATVLAERASAINPFIETRVFGDGLRVGNIDDALSGVTVVFDGIDVVASSWEKYLLHERACAMRIPVMSGMDYGGKAVLYIFDYRRRAIPFYGKATAEAHREKRFVECFKWLGYTHFPTDFLPIIRDRLKTSEPWPQVSYCVQAMGAIGTRSILNLAMRRKMPHVVSFDTHMRSRRFGARLLDHLRWPGSLVRTYVSSRRRPNGRSESALSATSDLDTLFEGDPVLKKVVRAISLAPSPHNTQPWVLRLNSRREIRMSWNRARAVPCADPRGYGVALGLGCAIEAAASIADIAFAPGTGDDIFAPDYSAGTLTIRGLKTESYARNIGLLEKRSTNRQPYLSSEIPAEVGARCAELASAFGARAVLDSRCKQKLKAQTFEIALRQFGRREYVEELLAHIRMSADEAARFPAGMTLQGLGLNWAYGRAVALLRSSARLRTVAPSLGLARIMAMAVAETMERVGGFVLITTPDRTTRGQVDAGRALMRVWLELTSQDYACQPMDFPISTDESGRLVAQMFGLDEQQHPVALLRVGRALTRTESRSPRLPLAAFCHLEAERQPQ